MASGGFRAGEKAPELAPKTWYGLPASAKEYALLTIGDAEAVRVSEPVRRAVG